MLATCQERQTRSATKSGPSTQLLQLQQVSIPALLQLLLPPEPLYPHQQIQRPKAWCANGRLRLSARWHAKRGASLLLKSHSQLQLLLPSGGSDCCAA